MTDQAGDEQFRWRLAPTPCGRTRREFFWESAGGFVGTALATFWPRMGSSLDRPPLRRRNRPSLLRWPPRRRSFRPRPRHVSCLFMYGGVSQVDTFDPKPAARATRWQTDPGPTATRFLKIRNPGMLLGSSRKFARHGQAGTVFSDLYPHLAGCLDDVAVIRSMYGDSFAHGSGLLQMNTGFLRQGYPSLGSWVTYGLGTVNQNLPGYVVLLDHRGGPISGPPNWGSGFMPATYQGTQFRTSGEPILNLQPPKGISAAQQRNQLDLLAS